MERTKTHESQYARSLIEASLDPLVTISTEGKITDMNEAFIGSFNFTKNSLENNREVWIFIHGQKIGEIAQIFENDWQRAEVALDKK